MATISLSPEAKQRRLAKQAAAPQPPAEVPKPLTCKERRKAKKAAKGPKQPSASKETKKAANLAKEAERERHCAAYREAAADWLAITFPGLFRFPIHPFEVGITTKILAVAPPEIVPAGIKHCIDLWCHSDAYVAARDDGLPRMTLEDAQ